MLMLSISMRPVWTRIHLRRRGVALILGHVMALGLVGRVGRRIVGAGCRDRGIYRNVGVRLDVRLRVMAILLPIVEGHGRTCCLSHTCRAAGLGVRRVMVLRLTGQVVRIRLRASCGRVQTVVRLRRVGGGNVGGSHFRLGSVLGGGTDVGLRRVLSSSRSLVCS